MSITVSIYFKLAGYTAAEELSLKKQSVITPIDPEQRYLILTFDMQCM